MKVKNQVAQGVYLFDGWEKIEEKPDAVNDAISRNLGSHVMERVLHAFVSFSVAKKVWCVVAFSAIAEKVQKDHKIGAGLCDLGLRMLIQDGFLEVPQWSNVNLGNPRLSRLVNYWLNLWFAPKIVGPTQKLFALSKKQVETT